MPAMYINNLPENLQSTVKLFADDALLYGVITSDSDYDRLQDDLYKLEQWQDIWHYGRWNPTLQNAKFYAFPIKGILPKRGICFVE